MVASGGPTAAVSVTELVARRAFAGLFNAAGELVGIGSLALADVDAQAGGTLSRRPGNMFVPVNLPPAAPADLRLRGFGTPARRAWLALNCVEQAGQVWVLRVSDDSPADPDGLEAGDRILRIDGIAVQSLAGLWQAQWLGGAAEREIVPEIERGQQPQTLKVYSVDRMKTLRRPEGI